MHRGTLYTTRAWGTSGVIFLKPSEPFEVIARRVQGDFNCVIRIIITLRIPAKLKLTAIAFPASILFPEVLMARSSHA
jgi:hypothetical protein